MCGGGGEGWCALVPASSSCIISCGGGGGGCCIACTTQGTGTATIVPERGKLVIWRSYTDEGVLDPRARHTCRPLARGATKLLLTVSLRRGFE